MSRIDIHHNNKNNKKNKDNLPKEKKKRSFKNFGLRIFIALLIMIILAVAGGIVYVSYLSKTLPTWDESAFSNATTSIIFDKDNNVITEKSSKKNFKPVSFGEISPMFVNAVIATEDSDFYNHNGYSVKGIFRSLFANLFSGSKGQGGSTLTQQLARGVLLSSDEALSKDYSRKIKEILLAMQIEERLTKEEIFTHYANNAYFGHGAYGIEAASITYFNKHANELSDAEATLLAGLPQSPSYYDPYIRMDEALVRRDMVIKRLVETNFITQDQANEIKNTEIALVDGTDYSVIDSQSVENKYFTDFVTLQAERILDEQKMEGLHVGAYRIYTTMDPNVQGAVENTFFNNKYLFPDDMNDQSPEGAMIVIDHTTGEIRGLVGGRSYEVEQGFNRAIDGRRQPGSTFKPISTYGPAFEAGLVAPSSIYNDSPDPPVKDAAGREYELVNYDGSYRGNMSIRKAIANSTNTIAVRVLNDLGTEKGYEFAKRLGIKNLTDKEKDNLSLALGGLQEGVSPLEMARAYGVFANKGVLVDSSSIRKIEDSYGKVIYESKPKSKQVISQEVAYMVTNTLQDVVTYGTGTKAILSGREVAGKTGTTDMIDAQGNNIKEGNKDLWFVGYTPELTAAVWIGYDKSDQDHYLSKNYGSGMVASIWANAMKPALSNYPSGDFERPGNIEELNIDTTNGLPTNVNTGYTDIFIKGLKPTKISNSLVSSMENQQKTNSAKKNNDGEIELSWIGEDKKYTIYRRDSSGNREKIGTTNSTSFTDSSPPSSTPIEYIIQSEGNEINITYE